MARNAEISLNVQTASNFQEVKQQIERGVDELARYAKTKLNNIGSGTGGVRGGGAGMTGDAWFSNIGSQIKGMGASVRDQTAAEKVLWQTRYEGANRMAQLEMRRQRELSGATGPQHANAINQMYNQRAASLQQQMRPKTFLEDVGHGWSKAGGFGEAIGTVAKYAVTYGLLEAAMNAVLIPMNAVKQATIDGGKAFIMYQEEMAKASRTFQMPGMNRNNLKEILGEDALQFLAKYRTSMQEVAQSQYELGSANFNAAQIMQTYQVPLKVNIALNGDITQTTRLMTQMLKIHGDQMGKNMSDQDKMVRLGGILYKTWQIEQVELSDLAGAYKYVAGAAAALKIPAEQLIPTLGFLSTYGLRGSIGGTGLNQFFTQTAKNIQITADKITGLKKSTQGMDHIITMKPGAYSPFEMLIKMSQAMQKYTKDPVGMMKLVNAYSSMLNIRGARAPELLADFTRLATLLGDIKNVANATTPELKKMVEDAVNIMQLTPTGQWDIMKNKIFVIGTEFFRGALGANTLTDALVNVNKFLDLIIPKASDFGRVLIGSFKTYGATLTGATEGWNNGVQRSGISGGPLGAVMGAISGGRNQDLQNEKDREKQAIITGMNDMLSSGMKEGLSNNIINKKVNTIRQFGVGIYGQKYGEWPVGLPSAASFIQKVRAENAKSGTDSYLQKFLRENASYEGIPTTGKNGDAARKYKAGDVVEGYRISAGFDRLGHGGSHATPGTFDIGGSELARKGISIDDALSALEAKGYLGIKEWGKHAGKPDYSQRPHLHMVTPGTTKDKWVKWVAGIKTQQGSWTQGAQDFREQYNQMPGEVATKAAQDKMSAVSHKMLFGQMTSADAIKAYGDIINQRGAYKGASTSEMDSAFSSRKQLLDDIKKSADDAKKAQKEALTLKDNIADFKFGIGESSRIAQTEKYQTALDKLDRTETIYGATVANNNKKISVEYQLRNQNLLNLSSENARVETLFNKYRTATNAFTQSKGDTATKSELFKNMESARTDFLNAQKAADEFRNAVDAADSAIVGLKVSSKDITKKAAEEAQKKLDDAKEKAKDNADWMGDLSSKIMGTQSGWASSSGKKGIASQMRLANAQLALEMAKMRRDMPDMLGAKDMLDRYEQTMKADIIVKPWMDARSQIETEWTSMFQSMFSELSSGGNPLKAFDSIIKSIQGQMISGFVKRNLGGLFDQLATQQTGISASIGNSAADNALQSLAAVSSTTGTSLTEMSAQANVTSGALTVFTTNLGMASEALAMGAIGGMAGGASNVGIPSEFTNFMKKDFTMSMKAATTDGVKSALTSTIPTSSSSKNKSNTSLAGGLQNYSTGSMFGSMIGGMMGYNEQSSGMAGGLGYAAGMALGLGPIGAGALGLLSIFGFGKKKKKNEDPKRDIYGMPAFEWESYLYNYGKASGKYGSNNSSSMNRNVNVSSSNVGSINFTINGGDTAAVKKQVETVLDGYFGNVSRANIGVSY